MPVLFVGEAYDILKDEVRRVIPEDKRILEEVYIAYCEVRKAKSIARITKLRDELDLIHTNLVKRIEALEPN